MVMGFGLSFGLAFGDLDSLILEYKGLLDLELPLLKGK